METLAQADACAQGAATFIRSSCASPLSLVPFLSPFILFLTTDLFTPMVRPVSSTYYPCVKLYQRHNYFLHAHMIQDCGSAPSPGTSTPQRCLKSETSRRSWLFQPRTLSLEATVSPLCVGVKGRPVHSFPGKQEESRQKWGQSSSTQGTCLGFFL